MPAILIEIKGGLLYTRQREVNARLGDVALMRRQDHAHVWVQQESARYRSIRRADAAA